MRRISGEVLSALPSRMTNVICIVNGKSIHRPR